MNIPHDFLHSAIDISQVLLEYGQNLGWAMTSASSRPPVEAISLHLRLLEHALCACSSSAFPGCFAVARSGPVMNYELDIASRLPV